jgi:glycerate-2-kinase
MAAGVPIHELNIVRSALSAIKGGRLAMSCPAPILTLAASDVIGDKLEVIGSGPTIGPWLEGPGRIVDFGTYTDRRRRRAIEIMEREKLEVPRRMRSSFPPQTVRRDDRAIVISPMSDVARHTREELAARQVSATGLDEVMRGEIAQLATRLAKRALAKPPFVGYGEPTIRLPRDHGVGGRAQQLALELARHLRGTDKSAFVVGTDGKDGPATKHRPSPAGAYVDGTTWERIRDLGIDGDLAIARCDAGPALNAIDALVVTGPTGINHADLVIVG